MQVSNVNLMAVNNRQRVNSKKQINSQPNFKGISTQLLEFCQTEFKKNKSTRVDNLVELLTLSAIAKANKFFDVDIVKKIKDISSDNPLKIVIRDVSTGKTKGKSVEVKHRNDLLHVLKSQVIEAEHLANKKNGTNVLSPEDIEEAILANAAKL